MHRAEAYIERAEGAASREASEINRGVCEVCAVCSESEQHSVPSEHYIYVRGWLANVDHNVRALYILHHGKITAVGGRFLCARHLENVVFDLGGLP